jgi:single-strand DNA-binding protein
MKLLSQNSVFIGTLEYEPELRYTPQGKALVNLTIVINDQLRRCEAWDVMAEAIVEMDLKKGQEVHITGSEKTRKWDNREGEESEYEYIAIRTLTGA